MVLDSTGDGCLGDVQQLILRGMRLKRFDKTCPPQLTTLKVLSLSNNSLRCLDHFQHLVNLVELNLNFNYITSVEGLCCPGLRRLFLSNNLLASTSRLDTFPKLQTLCLFKNLLPDLPSILDSLRQAGTQLLILDLDGNPLARTPGYKHQVLRSCSRLESLDHEPVTQLDIDLSALYFRKNQVRSMAAPFVTSDTDPSRPGTAPACVAGARSGGIDPGHPSCSPSPLDAVGGLPLGKARLLRSDRLNNDP
ncbi:unnamed protein product, partial [Discosporangium mesarthrocarpum]